MYVLVYYTPVPWIHIYLDVVCGRPLCETTQMFSICIV